MKLLFILSFAMLPIILSFFAGLIAKTSNRNFWFWFWVSMPFPIIVHFILICMPQKEEETEGFQAITS